jgi:hypothetical protein
MPTIVAANDSQVLLDGKPVEGVRAVEYRQQQVRASVYALGSAERIAMVSGPQLVEGRLRVASTSPALNGLTGETAFQLIAELKHGQTAMTVTFDECFLQEKSFAMDVGSHGEAVYSFTATRVREELAAAPSA